MSRDDYVDIPVIAFLVEHPGAGPVLIDTGFHGSVAIDAAQAMGRFQDNWRAGTRPIVVLRVGDSARPATTTRVRDLDP